MRIIKRIIKLFLGFIRNPVLLSRLLFKGGSNIVLGKNIRVKNSQYFKVGSNVTICDNARFLFVTEYKGQKYNPTTIIGDNVFITYNFTLMAAASIIIHDDVLIASNVMVTSENHGMNPELSSSYSETPLEGDPVEICRGCWIGEKVIILPGVKLGERCIVAAGSVVTKSFPPYSLIAGVPAKLIKKYNHLTHTWERV